MQNKPRHILFWLFNPRVAKAIPRIWGPWELIWCIPDILRAVEGVSQAPHSSCQSRHSTNSTTLICSYFPFLVSWQGTTNQTCILWDENDGWVLWVSLYSHRSVCFWVFFGEIIIILAVMCQLLISLFYLPWWGVILPSHVHCLSLSCLLVLFWIFPHKGCMNWEPGLWRFSDWAQQSRAGLSAVLSPNHAP